MDGYLSDEAILKVLGERLSRYRLNKNMLQSTLAKEAGVSERTVNRIEHGNSVQLSNLIRVLRTLGLLQNLDALVPEPAISPVQLMKLEGKKRRRASKSSKPKKKGTTWTWGDDK